MSINLFGNKEQTICFRRVTDDNGNEVNHYGGAFRAKFTQNPNFADKLLATGDAHLEEGNTWGDRIWGTVNGSGANRLGIILMQIRAEIKESRATDEKHLERKTMGRNIR